MDVFAQIYPVVLPGIQDKESIIEKRELCVMALNGIQSITDATRTKTLWFEKHGMIKDSRHKLVAIYQPLKHYCGLFPTWIHGS